MKIIISHDIDHITITEHFGDFILPKMIGRSLIEISKGMISMREFSKRIGNVFFSNKLQNLDQIMEFDRFNEIPSTFFIGVNNGLGLNYPKRLAEQWIKRILSQNFAMGVHGIAFNDPAEMRREFRDFKVLSGLSEFGIRLHYLRKSDSTFDLLEKTGYLFDSSDSSFVSPYRIGKLWEFPVHIMDTYEFQKGKPWQNQTLENVKIRTVEQINLATEKNLPFLNILMHDIYFSDRFASWKQWYIWLIKYLKERAFEFIDFKMAIKELENLTPNIQADEI